MYKLLFLSVLTISIYACHEISDLEPTTGEPYFIEVDSLEQAMLDDSLINNYLVENEMIATKDSLGVYCSISQEGEAVYAAYNSTIEVKYKGYLLNGIIFDLAVKDSETFKLNYLIEGWKIGIPLIPLGGKATLLVPSALGYGSYTNGVIPPNSVLLFDIELLSIQ